MKKEREKLLLVGMGGHAKSIIDSVENSSIYEIIGYTDTQDRGAYRGYQWLGTDDVLADIFAKGIKYAFISIGHMGKSTERDKIYARLKQIGYHIPVISDRSAIISKSAIIGEGTFVGKGAVINADTQIGTMCIINTLSVIEHGCVLENNVHVAVGSVICGDVHVGENSFIGANATVIQGLKIGKNVIVGAGSTVLKDIQNQEKVYGVVK